MSAAQADAGELRRAVRAGEIVAWYQPIVELDTGIVRGVEALARWPRPDGMVPPDDFIPVAEAGELILELDLAVIRLALADLRRWQLSRPGFELSVNMSGRHLDSATGVADLVAAVDAAGVGAGTVCVELTETVRPVTSDGGAAALDLLRQAGLSVWLDDFGAGHASLQDLIRLPLDGIKLDRSFTTQFDLPRTPVVLRALTEAAHRMDMRVTLEGIETAAQASQARRCGCDLGQGFLWSRPVPALEVAGWVRTPG